MKLAHLVRRFTRALWPGAPAAADTAWVASVLDPPLLELWSRMPNHDRRHSIGVARGVEAALADTPEAGDRRWLAAALVHDIGKLDARLGVYGRVVATVCGAVGGRDMAEHWSAKQGFTRRVGLYLRHPVLGEERIHVVGGPVEAASWAGAHHDPARRDTLEFPPVVVAALLAADDD